MDTAAGRGRRGWRFPMIFAIAGPAVSRRSATILLSLIRRTPDITLLEIQERLIQNCGERFSISVLWRFFDRHGVTRSGDRVRPIARERRRRAGSCVGSTLLRPARP